MGKAIPFNTPPFHSLTTPYHTHSIQAGPKVPIKIPMILTPNKTTSQIPTEDSNSTNQILYANSNVQLKEIN